MANLLGMPLRRCSIPQAQDRLGRVIGEDVLLEVFVPRRLMVASIWLLRTFAQILDNNRRKPVSTSSVLGQVGCSLPLSCKRTLESVPAAEKWSVGFNKSE